MLGGSEVISFQVKLDVMAESKFNDFMNLFQEKSLWHVKEIQERLNISRQSVYRLKDKLQSERQIILEANMRDSDGKLLQYKNLPLGYLRWPEGKSFEEDVSFKLSKSELEALKTAVAQMDHLTPLLKSALSKLSKNNVIQKQIQADPIIYNPLIDNYPADLFKRVSKAIRDRRVASITYQNARAETKSYPFNAYGLIPSDQHFHLVGVSHNSLDAGYETVIRLRLDQISTFKLLNKKFKRPIFNIVEYSQKHFGPFHEEGEIVTIKIQFSANKAQYIRRTRRHVSQKVIDQKDGSVIWQINAPVTEYIVSWVVSYGGCARVIEPLELKEKVIAWAKGAINANT